jgi:hypothetical protein
MKYALPLILAAGPALAHPGAHLHPHAVEGWVIGLGLLACGFAAGAMIRARVRRK